MQDGSSSIDTDIASLRDLYYREGGNDPDDCAPYLQELFAEIIKAAGAQSSQDRDAKHYKAYSIMWNDDVGVSEVTEIAGEGEDGVNNHDDYDDAEGWYANNTHAFSKGKGG